MNITIQSTRKLALLGTVSALALAGPAFAQSNSSGNVEQVVVTGSRIVENGYQAPTPVTVATAADLALSSPTSIDDGLRKLPQLIGSTTPNTGSGFSPNNHGNVLNLRNLGANRTLIMLNGVRVPPTTFTNTVDVDILPQLLVQRVDIVTGGASASYGSDAVAGVVNYILNTKFTGIKGVAQAGVTQYGDAHNQRFGLAVGDDILDRGHILFSAEYFNNSGYLEQDRPWLYDQSTAVGQVVGGGTAGTLNNPWLNNSGRQTGANYATIGGEITTGPFANTNFISAGVYRPVQMGQVTGSPGFYYAPTDYINQPATASAEAANRNVNLFARFSYDLDDDTTAYVQLLGAQSVSHSQGNPNLEFSPQLQVFSGNAFLPAALQAQLTATNTGVVNYAKIYNDLGPIQGYERTDNYQEAVGIKGKVFGSFSWTLDYTHGGSIDTVRQDNVLDLPHFYAAMDAVVNPVNGQTVCFPSLSAIAAVAQKYANCVPFNAFGYNASSPAAQAYVTGTSRFRTSNSADDITGSIAGNLFDLPAGPLSVAAGGTYRTQHMGMSSNADPSHPPDATGERGVVANAQYYLTNQGTANAGESIEEGFAEFGIPVLKDLPFIQSLDMNAAVRVSNYSTTGEATTWKLGGVWKINDDLTVRATRSRDIRAPTLYDLFAGSLLSLSGSALDPHTNTQVGFNTAGGGNPNLKPEVGNTLTAGFTYQPSWLEGFASSIDFYSIEMRRAVSTLSALQILTACENSGGVDISCASITRPLPFSNHTPANAPSLVLTAAINAAKVKTNGADLDMSYKTGMWGGDMTFRAYFGYMAEYKNKSSPITAAIDTSGYGSLPHVKGAISANYTIGDWGVFAQENIIGGVKLGPATNAAGNANQNLAAAITGVWVNPQLPSFYQTDLTVTWHAPPVWGANTQLFGSINNLFDAHPPIVDGTIATGNSLSTSNGLYDTTGRAFVVGVRFDTN